jgi:hypothetical protein
VGENRLSRRQEDKEERTQMNELAVVFLMALNFGLHYMMGWY